MTETQPVFITASQDKIYEHVPYEWLQTGDITRLCGVSGHHTRRVLNELLKMGLVECKVDTSFNGKMRLWRLKHD